jgi:hypothetical protein
MLDTWAENQVEVFTNTNNNHFGDLNEPERKEDEFLPATLASTPAAICYRIQDSGPTSPFSKLSYNPHLIGGRSCPIEGIFC